MKGQNVLFYSNHNGAMQEINQNIIQKTLVTILNEGQFKAVNHSEPQTINTIQNELE